MLIFKENEQPTITLCNSNYSPEGIYHPDRIMDEYDFLYMLDGEWDIYEDEILYHVEKGQMLILEPGKHHYSKTKCSPGMKNIFLHVKLQKRASKGVSYCFEKITDADANPKLRFYIEQMIDVYWSKREDKEICLDAWLTLFLLELQQKSILQDAMIEEILQMFHRNQERFYSPEELAKQYGISIRTLGMRFKEATGETIHQFQMNQKLDLAKAQLPFYPNRSLKDIAISYGFYDEFQFSRLFKRRFGVSPSNLKKRIDK